ncbi:MAG: PspA/IM30 family protein [Acidobacteriota bacterium]
MALLERVAALLRANLNDLIDKAEDPEKMMKQVILDMQNQLLQVKTSVAIAIADEHMLSRKAKEQDLKHADWMRKAEIAVQAGDDELARGALDRAMSYRELADGFEQQVGDQKGEVDSLRSALGKLEQKLAEARSKTELLAARHRRARAGLKASEAKAALTEGAGSPTFDRMREKVDRAEALNDAYRELSADTLEDRFDALEKERRIEALLDEIKSRRLLQA